MKITVDKDKAYLVFEKAIQAFRNRIPPYDDVFLPQENLPKNLVLHSTKHALFLFCLCYYMRGGIKSDIATISLAKFYERQSFLFLPRNFHEISPVREKELVEELSLGLRGVGLKYISNTLPLPWIQNMQKLYRFWEGDPVNLIRNVSSYEEVYKRLLNSGKKKKDSPHGFWGFQEKMASMLTYFLVEAGFEDPFHFPVPVDFHALRILVSSEILNTNEEMGKDIFSPELLEKARKISYEFCMEKNESPLDLCSALWLLSRTWCQRNIGNMSSIGEYKGRNTKVESKNAQWNSKNTTTYENTCGSCFLRETCRFNIPSAPYYKKGELIIRSERKKAPQFNLFQTM